MQFTKRFCQKSLIVLTGLLVPYFHACLVGAVQIKEYSLPTAKSTPAGITSGPDGALWFTEFNGNKIGRIDPATHIITEYPIPTLKSGVAEGISSGSDGAIWFTEGGTGDTANGADQIGRIDPITHQITEYPLTKGNGPALIVSGPDGAIWFTEQFAQKIGRIDPSNPTIINEYPTPSSDPWGITLGPDNALWFNECGPNYLVRIDPTNPYVMQEYYNADGICGELTGGPDNAIWFSADHNALHPRIGRFDLSTNTVEEYPVPTPNSNPDNITLGPDGAIWFNEFNASKIGRIDPITHQITEYPTPTHGSGPIRLVSGPDGALWFAEAFGNKIGQVILPNAPAVPTGVTAQNTGAGEATVSFTPPASSGDSSITGYTVRSIPDGGTDINAGSSSTTHTVTGLTNGTSYTFTVTATNANGFSNSSKPSKKITTWTAPSQPKIKSLKNTYTTDVTAQVTVKFSAPKLNGGTPITGYMVTALTAEQVPAGSDVQANSTSLTHVVNDLPPGKPYTFTVTATNAAGLTSTANASKAITAVTIPYCVTDLSATAPPNTKGTLQLTFTPPYDGGSPITKYFVYNKTVNIVGPLKKIKANDATTMLTVTGLKRGQPYTIQIGAANVIGANVCSNILTSATPN